jgi:Ca2+-binding EF-hand superfamily protein
MAEEASRASSGRGAPNPEELFKKYDNNQDGCMSFDEFQMGLAAENVPINDDM